MGHADAHDDLDGFCCAGCKDDAAAGRVSSCDGGSCAAPAKPTGCAACGAKDRGNGRGTGCLCNASRRVPMTSADEQSDPMAMRMPGTQTTGRIIPVAFRGRSTGALALSRPVGMPEPTQAYATDPRFADTIIAWSQTQPGETRQDALERNDVFNRTLQLPGESNAAWVARLASIYPTLTGGQKNWFAYAAGPVGAWLPRFYTNDAGVLVPGARPAGTPAPGGAAGGVTLAESNALAAMSADEQSGLRAVLARPAGQSDGDFALRIELFFQRSATPAQRTWIAAARAAGHVPVAPGATPVPPPAGSTPPAGTPASANTGANAAQIIGALGPIIAGAGTTVIGLVHEANLADAQARRDAATAEAARIASATSQEAALSAAVTAAEGAAFDAQTAGRQLRNGDRITATTTLSGAQGRLAAALGAAVAFGSNATLAASLARGRDAIATVATALDSSAPAGTSQYGLDILNPGGVNLAALGTQTTKWYQQPLVIGAAVLAAAFALFAGKKP